MNLEPQETWQIQDASKLQQFMSCPRQYFFRYVLGWTADRSNIHLEYGTAVHTALEHLQRGTEPLPHKIEYDPMVALEAYNMFEEHYREHFSEEMDDEHSPKNPGCTAYLLENYIKYYNHDDFDILHTEVSGCVLIAEGKELYFKLDTICRDKFGIFSLEHKTSSRFTARWAEQWKQKIQTGTYTHVLNCMFPEEDVYGVRINGLFPQQPPRLKKDGTPYANAKDPSDMFQRVPIPKNNNQMNDWLFTVNFWYDFVINEFEALNEASESEELMTCFPKNTENCSKYFGCPYRDYCYAWANPLQHTERVPVGFKVEHWDPRDMLTEAREVVRL